jgi:hypothetical protein
MSCVTTVSYAVLVNGSPTGQISPTRGIRQGDPISPYLFIICAEALSSLLYKAELDGTLSGVPTSKGGLELIIYFLLMIACFSARQIISIGEG